MSQQQDDQHTARAGVESDYDTLVRITTPRLWVSLVVMLAVVVGAVVWSFAGDLDDTVTGEGVILPEGGLRAVPAPGDGVVVSYAADVGDEVAEGDALATLRDGDSGEESDITAPHDGVVVQRDAVVGRPVAAGDPVAVLSPGDDARPLVYAFVSLAEGKAVTSGQQVKVTPERAPAGGLQHFEGTVESVSELPVSSSDVQALTGSGELGSVLAADAVLEVRVSLDADDTTVSGAAASNAHGDGVEVTTGMLVTVEVVVGSSRPIDEVFS